MLCIPGWSLSLFGLVAVSGEVPLEPARSWLVSEPCPVLTT